MRNRLNDERGAVVVLTAILMVVLFTMVALVVDVGGLLLRRREMVNGADASALAGALTYVRSKGTATDGAISDAINTQFAPNSPGSVSNSPDGWECTWDMQGNLKKGSLTVDCHSTQPLYFAPVFGVDDNHAVDSTATASWKAGGVITGGTIYPDDLSAKKVYVCKYTAGGNGQPEILQTGQNPIEIARTNKKPYPVGEWFVDNQVWSYVLAPLSANPPPTREDCPQAVPHVWLSN